MAEHAYDETTALSLYDCLVPQIVKHNRVTRKNVKHSIQDILEQRKAIEAFDKLCLKNQTYGFKKIVEENAELKKENDVLKQQQEVLNIVT